jgi:1-aminocyclopropane-1-carboxylate deaminase/D-cysteine desulfhydrase-like pyridoxal-dependent ACC family enzyme
VTEGYQNLIPPYPRFPLATLPTPLERAERLEGALRDEGCVSVPRIFIKRDDLLSLGMGGNKIRNLEFQIGEALALGATDIVTAGRQQSNHCRLTAAACAKAGLRAHLIVNGTPPEPETGNLLLDRLFDGRIYYTLSDDRARRQAWIDAIVGACALFEGRSAYAIPVGGSNTRGALGHVLAAAELLTQCEAIGAHPGAVVLASATGGTQAGMLCGLRKLGSDARVTGFTVSKAASEFVEDVRRLAHEVADEIGLDGFDERDVAVDGAMLGDGYGAPTPDAAEAIRLVARTEGLVADPIYTGKAFAGLLQMVRDGAFAPGEDVVFVHTGGAPAMFA